MSKWRERYPVHPAADVFPMMSDAELAELGEDIKKHGLTSSIVLDREGRLVDGRNRLEAIERIGGIPHKLSADGELDGWQTATISFWVTMLDEGVDPVAFVISANIHRRHLTKQQQADLIVAALNIESALEMFGGKPRQVGEVSKGGRGKVDQLKAEAVAAAKEHDISTRTIERAIAKAEGRTPKPTQRVAETVDERRERQRKHCEAVQARRDEKAELRQQRRVDVREALAILERLDLKTAMRLVELLMNDSVVSDVSIALVDKENKRDDRENEAHETASWVVERLLDGLDGEGGAR